LESFLFEIQANKIRQIASTVLHTPEHLKGSAALKAQEYLDFFLKTLTDYENPQTGDEDQELRVWANIREMHQKFLSSGGF
jgi:hypothetical protein